MGCYGHEQDGKEYLTHYVADGKGYRLVPHQALITVYPKDGGEPRQASFVDAFGKEEIDTANVKYLFPGGCKSPVIEYKVPVFEPIVTRQSQSSAAAKAGARGGKSARLGTGSDTSSRTQGDENMEGVIKDELTNVARLSGARGRQDKSLKSQDVASGVGGKADGEAAVPIAAIHHNNGQDSAHSNEAAHTSDGSSNAGSGSSNNVASAGKLSGGSGSSGQSKDTENSNGHSASGALNGKGRNGPGATSGNVSGGASKSAGKVGTETEGGNKISATGTAAGNAEIGASGRSLKNGAGVRKINSALDGSGDSTGNAKSSGVNIKAAVNGDGLHAGKLTLTASSQASQGSDESLKVLTLGSNGNAGAGARTGTLGANSLASGGPQSAGGAVESRTYIPPISPSGKSSHSASGASSPQTKDISSKSLTAKSNLPNSRADLSKNVIKAPFKSLSSDDTQCPDDRCCDESRPQLLLWKATPGGSCCKPFSKVVIPIDMEKLAKIATAEIIEVTSETSNAALLKKLLKLVEKYDL